ncbi:MAG: hypothetical protein DI570_20735 [Phenylobacterium zucineum]|nr:MAG: hypothetical protein DI570_20735 [Phenylobacterium zucineum]
MGAALDRWLVEPSLQSAYEHLSAQLARSERRYLVLIDDLDRLEPDEIKTIVQMVKSVGRLPNVIYLLAYDREIVWNALGREAAGPRPGFMEKIVQQEVELPPPTRDRLMRMLAVKAGFLGGTPSDDMRWHYLLQSGFFRWIRSPRDVARLANAARFAWASLEDEVDPHELLAMEAMRLFDNGLYGWVRDNRDFLLGGASVHFSDKAVKDAADALREALPVGTRDDQLQVVAALFPGRAKAFLGDRSTGGSPYFVAHNRGGVQSPAGYDSYFALHPSPDAVPKTVVRSSMARLDDEAFQIAQLAAMLPAERENGAPLVADYLADLAFRFMGQAAPRPTQALLNAIFAKSDALLRIDRAGTDFTANPLTQILMLLHQMFEQLGPEDAGAGLLVAAEAHPSPVLFANLWLEEAVAHGRLSIEGERRRQPRIDATALDRLGKILLQQIQDHKSGPLLDPPPLIYGVWKAWSHLADSEAPRRWLAEGADRDPDFLVAVARSYLATSGSVGTRQFFYSARGEQLMDPEVLLVAAKKHRDAKFLSADDRARVSALIEGLVAELAAKAAPSDEDDHSVHNI